VNRTGERAPFYLLPGLHVDISASEIRAQIRAEIGSQHRSFSGPPAAGDALLPAAVLDYILSRKLYR